MIEDRFERQRRAAVVAVGTMAVAFTVVAGFTAIPEPPRAIIAPTPPTVEVGIVDIPAASPPPPAPVPPQPPLVEIDPPPETPSPVPSQAASPEVKTGPEPDQSMAAPPPEKSESLPPVVHAKPPPLLLPKHKPMMSKAEPERRPPVEAPREENRTVLAQPSTAAPAPAPNPSKPDAGGASSGPRVLSQPLPEIPDELRRHAFHMEAVVRFSIAADGSATAVLEKGTPDARLNAALLAAFNRWRFFPAVLQGKPVASTLTLNVPVTVQ